MISRSLIVIAVGSTLASCVTSPMLAPREVPRVTEDMYARFALQHAPSEAERAAQIDGTLVVGDASARRARLVSYVPELPLQDPVQGPQPPTDQRPTHLQLEEVVRSVEENFPLILAAMEQFEVAAGQVLGAEGSFDTKLSSKNKLAIEDFYENERYDIGFEQPTQLLGTIFSGGYSYGAGDFADYDGEAETNAGGEVRIGVLLPLLRGSRIDENRIRLWQARIEEQRAEPQLIAKRLSATRKAAAAYWKWVAAGEKRRIAIDLLALAQTREDQLRAAVEEGLLAQINLVDNERLIVEREANLIRAERGLQEAAILLSLFWRDGEGNPIVEDDGRLPGRFPLPRNPEEVVLPEGPDLALVQRPEVRAIEMELDQLELELDLARNNRLADLDVGVFASQDLGGAVSDPDDKGPFELEARVEFELPLQRRKARGKEREVGGKIAKREHELRLAKDQVIVEVQDVESALRQSFLRAQQAEENVELARELEDAERLRLRLGESDLFRVNLREQQTAVAALSLVGAQAEYFQALADYRAALGIPYDEVVAGLPVGGTSAP